MYDQTARAWAQRIETAYRELGSIGSDLKAASLRLERLRSQKYIDAAQQDIQRLTARTQELTQFVDTETEAFFDQVLGVFMSGLVQLVTKDDIRKECVIAKNLRVRCTTKGEIVLYVWGPVVDPSKPHDKLNEALLSAPEIDGATFESPI